MTIVQCGGIGSPSELTVLNGQPGCNRIEHLVVRLVAEGFEDLVINHAHLGARIEAALGDARAR